MRRHAHSHLRYVGVGRIAEVGAFATPSFRLLALVRSSRLIA